MRQRRAKVLVELIILVACLCAAGCQSTVVTDKTGGDVITLRLASIDSVAPNGQVVAPQAFIEALEKQSGGRIRVTVENSYENGAPTAETDLVKAIASGQIDGGWPTTRAFARAGIRSLMPLEAPFILTSYEAEKALATGPEGAALLGTLQGSGVVGLGLAVGPLRRPWSTTRPLVDVRNWQGITFRSYNSPIQEAAIRALGAVPVRAGYQFPTLVEAGRLEGVELDVAAYAYGGYTTLLPELVGNEVLWPRMEVLALSQEKFAALTGEEQGWVRAAAQDAVQASVDFPYADSALAESLCALGVRVLDATPEQLAGLRQAVQPVVESLRADPEAGPSLALVRQVAARFPAVDALRVRRSCHKT